MSDIDDNVVPSQPGTPMGRPRIFPSSPKATERHNFGSVLLILIDLLNSKHDRCSVAEMEDVYEEVDEREYSKRRQDKLQDDWIVDDDGCGYVEDGREIFESDDEDIFVGKKEKVKHSKSSSGSSKKASGNIKNLLINMPSKKKKSEKDVGLDDDALLGDILQDLNQEAEPMKLKKPSFLKKKVLNKPLPLPNSGSVNPFSTKLSTTPVRIKESPKVLKPRSISSENIADVPDSPKAKRSLDIKEENKEDKNVEEFDTMDMIDGFDDFDNDMEDIENMESSIVKEEVKKEVKQESKIEVKLDNRGFTLSNQKMEDSSVSTGWDNIKGSINEGVKDVQVDSSQLPLTTLEDGSQVLRMYWLDAYEDYYKQPGVVYLFGKVWIESAKSYVSCCLQVKNIEKRVFLLPRQKKYNLKTKEESEEPVKMMEVYQEFNDVIAKKFKILQFKSKMSTKRYAFEKFEIPAEAEYLEVRYSPEYPSLPSDVCGETFSHVFGSNTSSLEMFLLDRKIKGPSWIEIHLPQLPSPPVSWCKVEAVALNPSHVTPISGIAIPPVVVMAIGLRTTINPKTHQNEIAMVSSLVHSEFSLDKSAPNPPFQQHFCTLTHPGDVPWPWDFAKELPHYTSTKIEKMDTERALLGFLLAKIHKIDPDLVVGHDILGFDLSVLLHRINHNKIPHWSRLGRLKRTQMMKLTGKGYAEKMAMCGRLVCDIKISAKELIRAKSYDLGPLVGQVLREPESQRRDLDIEEVKKMYDSSKSLLQLVTMTMQDTSYILRILCELNALPLALQITNIAGNVMSRTLLGGRSERNEFLLLHAFTEKNFIPPDKQYAKANIKVTVDGEDEADSGGKKAGKGKRKAAYAGGLVLEPKKGFYDKYILLMDFNSLYPSIIQEYNICFTTMERIEKINEDEDSLPSLPEADQDAGVLPTEIRKLVESRKQVKQLMKQANLSNDLKLQYDIRQKALKLTANSMYGCLGFQHSRFYAKHLAALVTSKGREILLHTRDLVQKLNFDVIYGDTDSIMINTNCTDFELVFTLGQKIKSEVNKLYKLLELDVDGVYKYMLLLKKKKYAALTVSRLPNGKIITEQELKGLDIVRRDWSQLASDAGRHILQQILSDQNQDDRIANIHSHLEELKSKLHEGKFGLDILAITKQLTKNPEDYPDKKSLPHVQVALRINSRGGKKLRNGDTVEYVICDDGSNLSATQRAYHVDELKNNSNLTVDKNYYLSHQVHPVISRLCDPIEGTDSARIAECLGLDPSGYRVSKYGQNNEEDDEFAGTQISDEERYRMCERFQFKCPSQTCDTLITMDSAFRGVGTSVVVSLDTCPNPACKFEIYSKTGTILNKLRQDIRRHISAYYSGWLMCEDPGCNNRTRRIPLRFSRGYPICNLCERGVLFREYTESQLYKQLCFYDYIFDFHKACLKQKDNERIRNDNWRKAYNILHNEVQKHLNLNAYSEVNLTRLFGALFQSG
ncbi:unnamed protein product, partial [Meganyctiphanes norvegica]